MQARRQNTRLRLHGAINDDAMDDATDGDAGDAVSGGRGGGARWPVRAGDSNAGGHTLAHQQGSRCIHEFFTEWNIILPSTKDRFDTKLAVPTCEKSTILA